MVEAIRFRNDEGNDEPAVSLDAFLDQSNATAVRIEAGEDARLLLPLLERISLVEIDFPVFGDGRGYSSAQILREAGYDGELRASGDILVDQIAYMRRCGFDAFTPDAPIDSQVMEEALGRHKSVYQATSDQRAPIWRLRRG
jgi:uncharacterized protein (DUF934 family)